MIKFNVFTCYIVCQKLILSSVENIFQGRIIDLSHQTLSPNDLRILAIILLQSPNKHWKAINLLHCNIDDNSCSAFCLAFQKVPLNVKSVDVSNNEFDLEHLSKLCKILKSWNTEELAYQGDFQGFEEAPLDFTHYLKC